METKTFKTFIKTIKKGEKEYNFITLWCKNSSGTSEFFTLNKVPSKQVKEQFKQLASQRGYITMNEKSFNIYTLEKNGYINAYIDILDNPFLPF